MGAVSDVALREAQDKGMKFVMVWKESREESGEDAFEKTGRDEGS